MKTKLAELLLDWYKVNGRDLPWRYKGGAHPNPYAVLVSEFMLQQTTVKTVVSYFDRFMERFPTVFDLAKASEEEVFACWQGLGYYSRAKALLQTAKMIVEERNGVFPETKKDVLALKGIGLYTVASFLALAFNKPESVVDGNVIRVICRLFHITQPLESVKDTVVKRAKRIASKECPADYASAIMDLGALVCTPKNPQCFRCPWQAFCRSKNCSDIESIPQKKKLAKKERHGFVYLVQDASGNVFIRKRTEKGLLSGLYELPWNEEAKIKEAKFTEIVITHVFTHFKLTLQVCTIGAENWVSPDGFFVPREKISDYPASTLMKKVYREVKEKFL